MIADLKERLKDIKPYQPSPYVEQLADEIGVNQCEILKLDANENLFLSKHFMQQVMIEASYETDPRLYPEKEINYLRSQIAELNGVKPSQVIIASGGDQIIELLLNSLVEPGDKVCAVTPTFSMYPRASKQRQLEYVEAPLNNDFTIDVESMQRKSQSSRLLIICNPNNPTGNIFDREKLIQLIAGFDGFVLIDEAYSEFGEYSLVGETGIRDNLLILRTFSKAYGFAGLRLGYCITNSELAEVINTKCIMPYPVPSPVLRAGSILIRNQEIITKMIQEAVNEREALTISLNEVNGVTAYPSSTNFVLFNTEKPYTKIYEGLKKRGILVRVLGGVLDKENCLRVTVAPRPMMTRFIEALKEVTR